ncbi:ABC transporter permease [Devosia sp. 919]|uniref:ABC transporter permease n=1 Tax=Devosia sp. 919 TaxID=2726065 RepID=UPI0015532927|nr:ABC transporter permease [Devosia sp. 919]
MANSDTISLPWRDAFQRFLSDAGGRIGLALILAWILIAVFAHLVSPYDPNVLVGRARQAPSPEHWFGTDMLGRDMLSRVLHGSRVSLMLGAISVLFGIVPGVSLGLAAGYFGGWVDALISRFVDALLAFPSIILALIIIATLGPGIFNVMIAVGISAVPEYARLMRGSVLAVKSQPYVEAAWLVGNGPLRIMARHIFVNANAPLVVFTTLQVGNAILVGAGLSFLGLGAQPPTAEWGLMSSEGRQLLQRAWWISAFPGLAILTVVIGFNLLGDGLRAALDPKIRAR